MNRKLSITLVLLTILVVSTAGVTATIIIWSNTVPVTVSAITLTLSANSTSLLMGETVRLTATLSGGVISDKTIILYINGASNGTAVTDSLGKAIFDRQLDVNGTFNFNATVTIP